MSAGESKAGVRRPFFETRGVVIVPEDLTLEDWPERARRAGLTTIALHPTPKTVMDFVQSKRGRDFLDRCAALGLETEFELHAMCELLPRDRFEKEPDMFRMSRGGERTPDSNLCVHSRPALDIVAENVVAIAKVLRPTTSRYFYWGDDGKPWCRCPKCREFSESDQALFLENRMLEALREGDPKAQLAHLAYANTLKPPRRVAPQPGIFLEFAPIKRRWDVPLAAPDIPENRRNLELLDAHLRLFSPDTAQVLEYWLDCSLFSKWNRQLPVKVPWAPEGFAEDLDTYGGRGIRHITTFAVQIDAEYVARYGDPPLDEYGALLARWPQVAGPER